MSYSATCELPTMEAMPPTMRTIAVNLRLTSQALESSETWPSALLLDLWIHHMRLAAKTVTRPQITRKMPKGIACVGRQCWSRLIDFAQPKSPVVALHVPQDPGNLGTILRTCDATACSGVIVIGEAVDPWHPTALRAAMGATFSVPIARCDLSTFKNWASEQHLPIVGASD